MAASHPEARSTPLAKFLAPGMRLGKYQLIRQLAIGGMAEVYLARANGIEGFQKRVVLKRILPQFATNAEFVDMFLDEARLAGTLDHPNIVHVYDIGQQVGNYYFTMEYVPGQDVREILKHEHRAGRAVPIGQALTIVHGLCAGLHYAHEKTDGGGMPLGLVHRDVSLSNILVSYDGAVKIADFGVAKCVAKEAETRAGTLKGKIAYMSPEQCRGEPLDRRSDVFAAGIILYELTTGKRLFTGESEFAILQHIATHDVEPPSAKVDGYPPGLEAIVLKALRRDRDERYQSCRELQRDLEAFARDERISISPIELSEYMREQFAEQIAAQPSDSGVSGQPPLRAAAVAGPRAGSATAVLLAPEAATDGGGIVVIDATDGSEAVPASGGVHTAMFDLPPTRLATGSESGAQRAVAAPTDQPRPRGIARRVAAAIVAVGACAALALATLSGGDAPVAGEPATVAPPPAADMPSTNVHVAPAEPPRNPVAAPAHVVAPAPAHVAASTHGAAPREAKPARATAPRRTRTRTKGTDAAWDPDSALPPSL